MLIQTRRTLLKTLTFGAGGVALSPLYRRLVREARANEDDAHRVVFVLIGQGLNINPALAPVEYHEAGQQARWDAFDSAGEAFTWPEGLAPLEPYRSRIAIIDGLSCRIRGSQHTCSYGALNCISDTADGRPLEFGGLPGAATIDQRLGTVLSAEAPRDTLLAGVGDNGRIHTVFAKDRGIPNPTIRSVDDLHRRVFGNAGDSRRFEIIDSLRADVQRMNHGLASPEKSKLDQYLASLEEYERLQQRLAGIDCGDHELPPAAAFEAPEDRLMLMGNMGAMALGCGMTNVFGLTLGVGHGHGGFAPRLYKLAEGTPLEYVGWYGHAGDKRAENLPHILRLISSVLASMMSLLDTAGILDDTTFVVMSDNAGDGAGAGHHTSKKRWPCILIGDGKGRLRTGGRFLRFAHPDHQDDNNKRGLADLFHTMGHAMGVDLEDFGADGPEPIRGPIPELLPA